MAKKKKNLKKVNRLTIKECEAILSRLDKDKESQYYNHVLTHYRSLLPNMGSAVTLGRVSVDQGKTAPHITK